jgi:hypothetical protein
MAFTRFHDDPIRIKKQVLESTGMGRYQLETPGPTLQTPFLEDPHIRLQRWGANLRTNTTQLETDFLGINRKLTHDVVLYNQYSPNTSIPNYTQNEHAIVDESRATHPAWMFRDLEQSRWAFSFHNVQEHVEVPFLNNQSTRIIEKDTFAKNN